MDCRKFQLLIPDFINDTMSDEDIEQFVEHSKSCVECYDELEIYYMLYEGLDKIENEIGASYDLKGELDKKLKMYEEYTYNSFKMRVIGGVVSVFAQIVIWVCILLRMVNIIL